LDAAGARLRAVAGIEIMTLAGGISPLLTGELDIGEAAVIQLAIDLPGATVVLDDLKARRVARRSGIALTGSLGVLIDAKRAGKLDSVAEAVNRKKLISENQRPPSTKRFLNPEKANSCNNIKWLKYKVVVPLFIG
jgi:predicted nucleic acid-binding protein